MQHAIVQPKRRSLTRDDKFEIASCTYWTSAPNILKQGNTVHILHSEDCSVCCQNADQETFQHGSFSYSIHTAIRLYPDESCAVPDP